MIKTIVNPAFKHLQDFISSLPERFEKEGSTVHKARNEIKVFEVEGLSVNVKAYRVPIFINRVAYSFFRPSKARRAYEYAFKVLEKGFETPEPIAYIEEYKGGLLHRSFFISTHSDLSRNFYDFKNDDVTNTGREELIEAFADYTAKLHESGILHQDYSSGNVLYGERDGQFHFSLIDINRMKFCPVDKNTAYHNFCRLCGNDDFFIRFGTVYAKARNFDVDDSVKEIMRLRDIDRERRDKKTARKQKKKDRKS